MVLELLLKLVDRLIDMAKHRQEMNRSTFADFVAPAMADFELVHKDYLESFRRYRVMLEDESIPLTAEHPIFEAIRTDNLFSEGLRAKISVLARLFGDPVLGKFISRVIAYLYRATSPSEFFERRSMQAVRRDYVTVLTRVVLRHEPESERRGMALSALDEAVQTLQEHYGQVVGEFYELKNTLLRPV